MVTTKSTTANPTPLIRIIEIMTTDDADVTWMITLI